jgi:hypothetical protein
VPRDRVALRRTGCWIQVRSDACLVTVYRGGKRVRCSARSHGCIRVDNRHIAWLAAHVPAGAPVRIWR